MGALADFIAREFAERPPIENRAANPANVANPAKEEPALATLAALAPLAPSNSSDRVAKLAGRSDQLDNLATCSKADCGVANLANPRSQATVNLSVASARSANVAARCAVTSIDAGPSASDKLSAGAANVGAQRASTSPTADDLRTNQIANFATCPPGSETVPDVAAHRAATFAADRPANFATRDRNDNLSLRKNRDAQRAGLTDRWCACGSLASLAWPCGRTSFADIWRCLDCARTEGRLQ